jgi:carbon storage regulator
MLVLTRKKNESIMIGDEIEIVVLEITSTQIRLGVEAPQKYPVYRKEIFLEIAAENRRAGQSVFTQELNNKLGEFFREIDAKS